MVRNHSSYKEVIPFNGPRLLRNRKKVKKGKRRRM